MQLILHGGGYNILVEKKMDTDGKFIICHIERKCAYLLARQLNSYIYIHYILKKL